MLAELADWETKDTPDARAMAERNVGDLIEMSTTAVMSGTRYLGEWQSKATSIAKQAAEFGTLPLPDKAKITVVPTRDPDWTIFERVRPIGMEQQSMEDLRIVRNLHDHGDIGGSRQILHVIHDLAESQIQPFVASMISLGYRAEVEAPELGVLVVHESEPSEVTSDSWTIRQVAERHGGRYDGWRCEVIRTPPKKRWFSRKRG